LVASTVDPGTAAPEESVTIPVMVAVSVCAYIGTAAARITRAERTIREECVRMSICSNIFVANSNKSRTSQRPDPFGRCLDLNPHTRSTKHCSEPRDKILSANQTAFK
jgi:hypothetical protein